jgi:probable HAF family extracellular repeat protein
MPRILSLALVTGAATLAAAQPPAFTVSVVSTPNLGPGSAAITQPLSLNNNGRVVGYGYPSQNHMRAMNWKSGAANSLGGVQSFDQTFANQVNSLGRIAGVGFVLNSNGQITRTHALKWVGGVMTDIGGFGGKHAAALAINDTDQVVGYASRPGEMAIWAFHHANSVMTKLNIFPGETESYAYDISNTRYIVGACVAGSPAKPFRWYQGVAQALPIPGSSRTGAANAVNDSGLAVGTYEINQFTGEFAAVAWSGGTRIELGNLGGPAAYAVAKDVNNSGQIVGTSYSPSGYSGFLWVSGQMHDLRSLVPGGVQITGASAINDKGQIAATAMVNGEQAAVILTPLVALVNATGGGVGSETTP